MRPTSLSVVLPVYRQADHIEEIVAAFDRGLRSLPVETEFVLVVNGPDDGSRAAARRAADTIGGHVLESERGWGRAVLHGLAHAGGDLLCFTNSARTHPSDLVSIVQTDLERPDHVVKADRRVRDNWRRRAGSALFNLECRLLFGIPVQDVNGTPKVFPRTFDALLRLERADDLIDAEFNVVCHRRRYPVIEVPVTMTRRHAGKSTTGYRSAVGMYHGAFDLWRTMRRRGATTFPMSLAG